MRIRLITIVFITLLAAIFAGCDKQPEYVLDKERMTALLYDIQLAEALSKCNFSPMSQKQKLYLYKSVFERHQVTPEQFDSCISWYTRHQNLYTEINKTIIARYGEDIERIKEYKAPLKRPLILTLTDSTASYFSTSDCCSHPYVERFRCWTPRWK